MVVSPAPFVRSFRERSTLGKRDRIVVRAIAEAMFSQDGDVEAERLDAHVGEVDAFISAASKPLRVGLRIALFVVRVAPVLLFFRMRMLESLSIDERVHVLGRLERSRTANLSLMFIGWRSVMTLVFYESPIELAKLGYATDERKVYKRRLPAFVPALVPALVLAPAPVPALAPALGASLTRLAPPPEESGVRLREGAAAAAESGEHKVA